MSKTLPITGAGAGIGRDAAFALAACGRRVIAATCTEARRPRLRCVLDPGLFVRLARTFGV
jgi:NAD(P)-dependent dehydrogenase (short-subunit alcohol dehydrogenase family)